jgi:hypothetical protein
MLKVPSAFQYGKNCIAEGRYGGVLRVYQASTEALRSTVLPTLQFLFARSTKTAEPIWIVAVLNNESRIAHTSHALNQ